MSTQTYRFRAALVLLFVTAANSTSAPTASPSANFTIEVPWYEGSYVGMTCEGNAVDECPVGQSCYSPTAVALAEMGGEYDEAEDDEELPYRCACWGFYGFTPDDSSDSCQPGESSTIIFIAFGVVAVIATAVAFFYWYSLVAVLIRWNSKRLKMNPAIACLVMGASGTIPMVFVAWGFALSALLVDETMAFERENHKGLGIGAIALLGLPCLLNVVNLWIDVALNAMSKGGTKKQRAATKKKVNCAVYTITAVSSTLVALLLLMDMVDYVLSYLVFMAVIMGGVYAYGGMLLSKALSQGMTHGTESSRGCCKTSEAAKRDMNCYMVTKTANGIAYSMACVVIGAGGYMVSPSRPNSHALPESNVAPPVAIAFLLLSFNLAFLVVVLYIRYGLRKVLDLNFPDAPKGATTLTTQTGEETPGRDAKVAPSPR